MGRGFQVVVGIEEIELREYGSSGAWIEGAGLESGVLTLTGEEVAIQGGESLWDLATVLVHVSGQAVLTFNEMSLDLWGLLWGEAVSQDGSDNYLYAPVSDPDVYVEARCWAIAQGGRRFGFHILHAKPSINTEISLSRGSPGQQAVTLTLSKDPTLNRAVKLLDEAIS